MTKRLSDFILAMQTQTATSTKRQQLFQAKYKPCRQTLLNGCPDYDPETHTLWQPFPRHFAVSLSSEHDPKRETTLRKAIGIRSLKHRAL